MAYIKQEFIDKVLQDADIIEVFHTYGDPVKKRGVNYFCKSPFTEEKSASCCVNPTTQLFKDFSSGKAGNIWTYIMHKNNCSYVEAIEDLAKKQGKTIEYESPEIAEKIKVKKEKEQNLRKYLDALLVKFQNKLFKLERSHPAWLEIKKRGYSDQDVKDWELGYAPGNYFMYDLFSEAGNVEAGKKLGLINDADADKLFNKLVYPIRDERGQLTGFASRRLDNNDDYAKWMNPSENELYDKKQTLYGLNIAKNAIVKQNRVWIVEGYNDVIAWHLCGQENTVAVSGTAFTIEQMKKLKKLTSKITLCLDGDAAGQKKVSQYVAKLLELGFAVEVCILPNDLDPDDYSRIVPPEDVCRKLISDDINLSKSLQPYITNGFEVYLKEKNKGDELDRTNGIREIIKTISRIPDIALRNLYSERLQKEAKVKPALIKELLREQEAEHVKAVNAASEKFVRPYGVTMSFEDIEPLVDKYELFIDNNQIYMQDSYSWPITFESVSNFSIEILQHMNDDKFPKKLLRVCNTDNEERIFDVPANTLNSLQRFEDALSDQGNYVFSGDTKHLKKLKTYLFDKMGVGRKVDILGWNPEGFFCWNNSVTIPGKPSIPINKDGIFHFDGHTYYVPSANEIYKTNPYRFQQQKKLVLKSASFSMEDYLSQMYKVHREFAIPGILFAFATAHQDIIFDVAKGFPEFFLYGPASTGKDQLFSCIKRMFGFTETDLISLENGQSTGKAKLRSFAEFSNMVVHLSEYTNDNRDNIGMLKELWGKNGYKIGTMDSKVSTDVIPILCSAMITGNQYPMDVALMSRLVFGEMKKNIFNDQEVEDYKKLAKMLTENITSFMDKVIWQRGAFVDNFSEKFNLYKKTLSKRPAFTGAIDRIITNFSVLGATYEILRDANVFIFPFSLDDMLKAFDDLAANLRSKISSASIFIKFWQLFLVALRGNSVTQLKEGRDYKIDGDTLYIQFTSVYSRIQTEWFPRFNEGCPGIRSFQDEIKNESYFIEATKKRMEIEEKEEPGTPYDQKIKKKEKSNAVSVYALDLTKMPADTKEDIENAIYWQRKGRNPNGDLFDSPATPSQNNGVKAGIDDDVINRV